MYIQTNEQKNDINIRSEMPVAGNGVQFTCVCGSLQLHGLYPPGSSTPWDSPGKNTRAGCHFLLQGVFPTQGWNLRLILAGRFFTTALPGKSIQFIIQSKQFLGSADEQIYYLIWKAAEEYHCLKAQVHCTWMCKNVLELGGNTGMFHEGDTSAEIWGIGE